MKTVLWKSVVLLLIQAFDAKEMKVILQTQKFCKSMKFPLYCSFIYTRSNAFLSNYSNRAPVELFQLSVTCDFTKDFDSKINTKLQINF